MAGRRTDVLSEPRGGQVRSRLWPWAILPALIGAKGAAFAAMIALDGSAVWRGAGCWQ